MKMIIKEKSHRLKYINQASAKQCERNYSHFV